MKLEKKIKDQKALEVCFNFFYYNDKITILLCIKKLKHTVFFNLEGSLKKIYIPNNCLIINGSWKKNLNTLNVKLFIFF
jgi:hypothetical protein